ncbi:MAG: YfcE family phosphodiesterase [Ruminococcaceae bacterium]|nr:YfcE family phosphodiesterase [Oscillospiraceae bacterium]
MVDLLSVYEREREACFAENSLEILIFSDSHGDTARMRKVIRSHPDAKHVLFCGDGLRDVDALETELKGIVFLSVKGNCDGLFTHFDTPCERLITLSGRKLLMMHGHTHGVKGSYGVAASHAASEGAEILLFGHTHIPYEGRIEVNGKCVHLFNPGSIGTNKYSYGILTFRENGYLFSHGTLI